jgi:hypothetical protein
MTFAECYEKKLMPFVDLGVYIGSTPKANARPQLSG